MASGARLEPRSFETSSETERGRVCRRSWQSPLVVAKAAKPLEATRRRPRHRSRWPKHRLASRHGDRSAADEHRPGARVEGADVTRSQTRLNAERARTTPSSPPSIAAVEAGASGGSRSRRSRATSTPRAAVTSSRAGGSRWWRSRAGVASGTRGGRSAADAAAPADANAAPARRRCTRWRRSANTPSTRRGARRVRRRGPPAETDRARRHETTAPAARLSGTRQRTAAQRRRERFATHDRRARTTAAFAVTLLTR